MKGSMNRKRVEEVREAKTKLEAQKAETVVKIQEVGNSSIINSRTEYRNRRTAFKKTSVRLKTVVGNVTKILEPSA